MTTPSNFPEEGPHTAPLEQPAAPADAAPPAPAESSAPPQPGPPWPPAADPFAPVYRAPRTPWVNPARRGHLAAAAIVGALLFGGGGLAIGHALSGDNEHHMQHNGGFMKPEHGQGMDRHKFGPRHGPRHPGGPNDLRPNGPGPTVPAPSGSPTG